MDHWDRASESIVEGIANGNSRRSKADRNQYFDVAIGSALECAACLDICVCKQLITPERCTEGKENLRQIVSMTDVYQLALKLVGWFDGFIGAGILGASHVTRLDKWTTRVVLNIAAGNGRFSEADQVRFIDIAHTSAMRAAACLDLLVARQQVNVDQIEEGKRLLARIVPLLLGLRGYLDEHQQ